MPGLPKLEPAPQVGGGDANESLEVVHDVLLNIDAGLKKKLPKLEPTPQVGGGDANESLKAIHDILLDIDSILKDGHAFDKKTAEDGHAFDKKTAADAKIKSEQDDLEKKKKGPWSKLGAKASEKIKSSAMGLLPGGMLGDLTSAVAGSTGKGLKSLWSGAGKAFSSPAMAKIMGPAAIAAGVAMMVADGMKGMKKAKEWNVSKTSAALGGAIGGTKSGWEGAMANAGKWAITGAGIGFIVGGPLGAAAGGIIGGAIGAVMGYIGGKKIAQFFEGVGKWVSEKWEIIKAFPGKIWDAVVGTVKGWLGLGDKEEVPVTITDKPKKGWLTSLTDFLIPQWIRDFAKDALGTVTGWLGLTTTDDQGKITSTAAGKVVFGTIGMLADFAMSVIDFFIPQFIKDFVKSPLTSVLSWLGLVTTDAEGKIEPTALGKKIFGTVTAVVDILESIIRSIIGDKAVDAIKKFSKNPLNYLLVDLLGWKTKEGKATAAGLEAVNQLEEGDVTGLLASIIKRIIGESTYNAIVGFAKDPMGYIMVNWLGFKTKEGTLTAAGLEAADQLKNKDFTGLWASVIKRIIGESTYNAIAGFAKDPMGYIMVNWLGLGSKDELTGPEIDKPKKGWLTKLKDILPDWMTDPVGFFKGIIANMVSWMPNWVKRKMGIQIPKTKEEVMAEQFELAQKEGLYDKDWMGYSEINKDALAEGVKSGKIQKEMLQAILADKDLSKDDTEFMQKLVKQATEEGSLFTHDQGLHDRLDRIFPAKDKNPKWTPSQKDSQRASEILRSNNVGTGSAPPMIINNTTQNVSQGDTNSTVVTIPDGETESFPGFGQRTKIA